MRRHDDVHSYVGNCAGKRQDEERCALSERDRAQAACGNDAADRDERPSSVPRRVAPITPATDEKRHREPGRRVHHHQQPDHCRRLSDVRQEEREVGCRHGAHKTRADSCRGENEQVGEAAARAKRERENGREPSRCKGIARDGAPRSIRADAPISLPKLSCRARARPAPRGAVLERSGGYRWQRTAAGSERESPQIPSNGYQPGLSPNRAAQLSRPARAP